MQINKRDIIVLKQRCIMSSIIVLKQAEAIGKYMALNTNI